MVVMPARPISAALAKDGLGAPDGKPLLRPSTPTQSLGAANTGQKAEDGHRICGQVPKRDRFGRPTQSVHVHLRPSTQAQSLWAANTGLYQATTGWCENGAAPKI